MSSETVDALMSEKSVLPLCASLPEGMQGSGTRDVDMSDVAPPGSALDLRPHVNSPQPVSARRANPTRPSAPCDVSLLRSASADTGLAVNESPNAHDMQPPSGPLDQWPGCNVGLTGSARGDDFNPSCVSARLGNPNMTTAFERGQTVSAEGSGDVGMDVDSPMPAHGSSPHSEPAVLQVGLGAGAGLDGPAVSEFACIATKVKGGGDPVVSAKGKPLWCNVVEEDGQGDQPQEGFGVFQALHAAVRGDQVYKESGQRTVETVTRGYHAATGRIGGRQGGGSAGGKWPGNSQRTHEFRTRTSGSRQGATGHYQIQSGDRNQDWREIKPGPSKPGLAGHARLDRTGGRPNSTYGEQSPRSGGSHSRPPNNNNKNYNNRNQKSQDATQNMRRCTFSIPMVS